MQLLPMLAHSGRRALCCHGDAMSNRAVCKQRETMSQDGVPACYSAIVSAVRRKGRRVEEAVEHVAQQARNVVVVAVARQRKCDEIVLGNSGLGAVAGLLLGSVARKVIALARTPVVLVK